MNYHPDPFPCTYSLNSLINVVFIFFSIFRFSERGDYQLRREVRTIEKRADGSTFEHSEITTEKRGSRNLFEIDNQLLDLVVLGHPSYTTHDDIRNCFEYFGKLAFVRQSQNSNTFFIRFVDIESQRKARLTQHMIKVEN